MNIKIFETVADLKAAISTHKNNGKTIGFVPTMGALHNGHMSLIKQSVAKTDITVSSIFVNPTQFDNAEDLKKYPRTVEKDANMLEENGCHFLFYPSIEEIYPDGQAIKKHYDFGKIVQVAEGAYRKGHFEGVAQVVSRLLEIVEPHKLFMGLKDYQQVMVIRKLIEYMKIETEIVPCEIIREKDGLAMSSRNMRLSESERKSATVLSEVLKFIKNHFENYSIEALIEIGTKMIDLRKHCKTDYIEIRNAVTLEATNGQENEEIVCLIAAFCGPVRLIDNSKIC